MTQTSQRPLLPRIENGHFTELQHRIDDRMRGVLGTYDMAPERTIAYDLERNDLFDRVESLVGNTPLLHVEDIGDSIILAKVESQNPTENHYDRVFPRTIRALEMDGVITPGDTLAEVTSGSGGRAFAWAAHVLGYKAHLIIPPELPQARVQDMINFGATVEVTEPGYMEEVSKVYVDRIRNGHNRQKHETPDYTVFTAEEEGRRVCYVNHSANELTVNGFDMIGEEIHDQLPEDEKIDFVVSVMGNGTSTTALSRTMKRHYPDITVVGLEDERSPYYYDQKYPGEYEKRTGKQLSFTPHDMFGSSAPGVRLKYGNADVVDEVRLANPIRRDLAQVTYNQNKPGFEQVGKSSAASLDVARSLAVEHPGSTIVIVFYDKADQYGDSLKIASGIRFHYDRLRPAGVPPQEWKQRRVGDVALLPISISEAYRN